MYGICTVVICFLSIINSVVHHIFIFLSKIIFFLPTMADSKYDKLNMLESTSPRGEESKVLSHILI